MSRKLPVLFILFVAVLASFVAFGPARRSNSASSSLSSALQATSQKAAQARILSSYGKLPLSFEKNQGQTDDRVRFLARGDGYALFLTSQEAVLRLDAPGPAKASQNAKKSTAVVRLAFAGSNQRSPVEGLDLQPGRSNYLLGNDPAKWHTSVPQYARVKYRGVYPGVDLIYYGNQGRLESDYVLAPGADPKQIALRVEGADSLKINSAGDLVLATSAGEVLLHQPFAYQESNGARQEIASNFVQRGPRTIGIQVASYDSSRPLVVDPVLVYATYLGGSMIGNAGTQDEAFGIAVDSQGNAYITGLTNSTDFPTKGPLPNGSGLNGAPQDAFVTKLNPTATALVYSTYLGGTSGSSNATGIAIDSAIPAHAFVTGVTAATDFPQTSNNNLGQGIGVGGSFLSELDPTGASLLYSTDISGATSTAIALDSNSIVYLSGSASLGFIVTANAFQSAFTSVGGTNAFISRIDTTKQGILALLYSSFFGGSGSDSASAIAVDSNANVFIAGDTSSADFPQPTLKNGFQQTKPSSTGTAFVARVNTTAGTSGLVYSSFLGGSTGGGTSPTNQATGIALGANSHVVVVGDTSFPDFPTTSGAFLTSIHGAVLRAFVSEFDTTGTVSPSANSLLHSTYFGGSTIGTTDEANAVAMDPAGNIYVTGFTNSLDFPVTLGAAQAAPAPAALRSAFMSQLNATATSVLFSTYLGGDNSSIGSAIALDPSATPGVYIAGRTSSLNFPTFPNPGVFQATFKAPEDAFIAKFSPAAAAGVFVNPSSKDFGTVNLNSPSSPQTFTLNNNTKSLLTGIAITFTGTNASDFAQTSGTTCAATLAASSTCTIDVIFTPTTAGAASATLNITFTGASGSPQTAALSGTGSATTQPDFTLAVAPAAVSVVGGANGAFTVTVTSQNNFSSAVALTCTGEPLNSTCILTPASVTPPSAGKKTSTGSLTTVAMIPPSLPSFRRFPPVGVLGIISLVLALLMARATARRGARKLAWGFTFIGVLVLAGCSGLPKTGGNNGTPKGTSTITITGTSGALSHTTTFSFTVN